MTSPAVAEATDLPRGITGAALTPFTPDGEVDAARYAQQLEFLATHCDLVAVLGPEVSEVSCLRPQARRTTLRWATEQLAGRVRVVVGASSPSVSEVVELSELGAGAGADFIQVLIPMRPWGGPATPAETLSYFTAVSERSALPVIAYHNPGAGTDASADVLLELSQLDRVVGFKESSRDLSKIARLSVEIGQSGRAAYLTTMQTLLASLDYGACGAMIPAPATLAAARIWSAFHSGDRAEAVRWQRCFAQFPSRWSGRGLAPVMKAAMRHVGLDLGPPSWPYPPVPDDEHAEIGRLLDSTGITELARAALEPASAGREAHTHASQPEGAHTC